MRKQAKTKKKLIQMICTSGLILSTSLMLATADAATITTSTVYLDKSEEVADDIEIVNGHIGNITKAEGFSSTISLNGNVKIVQNDVDGYALFAEATGSSGSKAILNINGAKDKNKTVQIVGDVKVHGEEGWGSAEINLNLSNKDSYLAGKLELSGTGKEKISLNLSNGATWYVPVGDDSYNLGTKDSMIHLSANDGGGIIDLYHQTPTAVRSSAGDRIFKLEDTGAGANGATFAISTDIANDKADKVILKGSTGTNTYYVQVVHDPSKDTDGIYTIANGGVEVLTSDNTSDTVEAKPYTMTKDEAAGLMLKTLTYEPTLVTNGGTTKLTSVTVTGNPSDEDGPAQKMANAASMSAQGTLSSWRAENNDLLRRMGDLRWDETNAGAWGRFYGSETEINSVLPSTLKTKGIQVGYDRKVPLQDGKLFTGVAISHMDGDISSKGGSGDTDSTMFGVYGSYQGEKGHFADAIIKYGRMSNQMSTWSTDNTLYEGDTSANGLNMSIEYGYHKEMKDDWYIEPQAEINYGHIDANDYIMRMNGASGANVSNDAVKSFIGRLGINVGKNTNKGNIYAKLSLAHEFSGDVGVTTSYKDYSRNTTESMKDTWLEYGIGFNQKLNADNNLYGEISKTAGADKITEKWKANIGFRHSF